MRSRSQNLQRLGYRRIVTLLVYLIIIPTVALLTLGIVTMLQWERRFNLIIGILMVSAVSVMGTGVTLVLLFLRREANLSELQADFTSKVSHELRTPLTAIRLFAETMERAADDPVTREKCLGALLQETARLTARIERLLDWGRMEAGRKQYELLPERVEPIIDEAMAGFAPMLAGSHAEVSRDIEPGLPHIMADRLALVDVLANLVSNAFKYGGDPPVIRIRAYAMGGSVAIEVIDNGPGIPQPEQRRIFDKFYRIDDRLSRTREGSGLGLAIVKHAIRAHSGKVLVVSEPGQGSTFRIVLRRATPSEMKVPAAAPIESSSPSSKGAP